MVDHSTNINKTNNLPLNTDGRQFHQYQQNKQKHRKKTTTYDRNPGLGWDRHKKVAGSNKLMGSQPLPHVLYVYVVHHECIMG